MRSWREHCWTRHQVVANCGVHFYRGTPITTPVLIRTDQLGDKVAATLGDRNAVLLRGHGGRWSPMTSTRCCG
jgi:hypothetical protein